MIAFRLYGATDNGETLFHQPPRLAFHEGDRIRMRLPPRFFGLSAEGARRLRAQENDHTYDKRELKEIYVLGSKRLETLGVLPCGYRKRARS